MPDPTPIRPDQPLGFASHGGGGDDGGMEARLSAVEKALVKIEASLPALATKDEMHKGFADLQKWIVGTAVGGMAVFITVMTFVLNNAVPKQPAPQAQPTVIVVPAAAPPASK